MSGTKFYRADITFVKLSAGSSASPLQTGLSFSTVVQSIVKKIEGESKSSFDRVCQWCLMCTCRSTIAAYCRECAKMERKALKVTFIFSFLHTDQKACFPTRKNNSQSRT